MEDDPRLSALQSRALRPDVKGMPSPTPRKPSKRSRTGPQNVAQAVMRIWALAGMIGACLAVCVAVARPFESLPTAGNALVAIALGWIAMLCFAPWRQLLVLNVQRTVIRNLTRRVRRIGDDTGGESLKRLILDRPDELGELSRAIHDALAKAHAARLETKRLQRTMDHEIRRETDRATHKLRREATTDPLTGLRNRRSLEARLAELFPSQPEKQRRRGSVVAMLLDMDRFKAINDTLGHDVGDECLAFLGRLLKSAVRQGDCAIRLGGDEFAVLMPFATLDEAQAVANRIATLFRQMPWRHEDVSRPTLSIGLSSVALGNLHGADTLMKQADRALYRSKDGGRDRVTIYGEMGDVAA
jgi:diguanylate cyclase (GGDEF)-like protein